MNSSILTKEESAQMAWIKSASLEDLLRRWRFAPSGDSILHGRVGNYYAKVMFAKRDADPVAWTQASKSVGWTPK